MPRGASLIRYDGKRGTVWRIQFVDADGVQVKQTVGAERDGVTEKVARQILNDRLSDVRRKAYRRPKAITFADWADTWLEEANARRSWKPSTVLVFRNAVRHLVKEFGPTRLDGIRPRDVAGYARTALDTFSAKTVQLHINVMHDIYKVAVVEELVQTNPVTGIERPRVARKRWRILEPQEVPRVSKAFTDDRARRVFLTFMLTALRRSELVALRWRHVNLVEGTLRVVESKSEEGERLVALPGPLLDELVAHFSGSDFRSDDDYVFAHPKRGSRVDIDWFRDQLDTALTAGGVEGHIRVHDLRHAALTNLAATGASPIAVMATAGHRSMSTTKQYVHLAGVVFRDDADALSRRLLGVQESGANPTETALESQNA